MKRWVVLSYWTLGVFGGVHACGGSAVSDSTAGNTNWLKYCDKQADCGEGLSCQCNSCQETCTTNTDCTIAGAGSRCAVPSEEMRCADAPAGIRLCVKSCDIGLDCGRDDLTCVSGACVPRVVMDAGRTATSFDGGSMLPNPLGNGVPAAGAGALDTYLDGASLLQNDRYGAFSAPACPARTEQLTFTLGEDTYVLDPAQPEPYRRLALTNCGGFAVWDIEACDSTREACVRVSHLVTADADFLITASAEISDENVWVTVLEGGDLGDSYWCQEDGFWRAWVDFSFTKQASQYDREGELGQTVPLTVTMQACADGQVCFGSDTPFPLRHCSEDPSVEVHWTCAATATTCDGDFTGQGCGAFCNEHDAARAELLASCASIGGTSIVADQACGYEVLQVTGGAGALRRAFYDEETGALIGIWSQSDTGEEQCSGSVPADCLDDFFWQEERDDQCAAAGDGG